VVGVASAPGLAAVVEPAGAGVASKNPRVLAITSQQVPKGSWARESPQSPALTAETGTTKMARDWESITLTL